jgi:hypothetical protein
MKMVMNNLRAMMTSNTATLEFLNNRVQRMLFVHAIISILQIVACGLKDQQDALGLIGLILYLLDTALLAYCWRITKNIEYRLSTIFEAMIKVSASVIASSWLYSIARMIYLSCIYGISDLEKKRRIIQITISVIAVVFQGFCAYIVYNLYEKTAELPFEFEMGIPTKESKQTDP